MSGEMTNRMLRLQQYFERHAEYNFLFKPEADAAKAVNMLITASKFTQAEAVRVVALVQAVDGTLHYNWSGWLDFKLGCVNYLRQLGFATEAEYISH